MPKPNKTTEWATGGSAQINEPSPTKKALGWVKEKPPFQWFNWLFNTIEQWLVYVRDEVLDKVNGDTITGQVEVTGQNVSSPGLLVPPREGMAGSIFHDLSDALAEIVVRDGATVDFSASDIVPDIVASGPGAVVSADPEAVVGWTGGQNIGTARVDITLPVALPVGTRAGRRPALWLRITDPAVTAVIASINFLADYGAGLVPVSTVSRGAGWPDANILLLQPFDQTGPASSFRMEIVTDAPLPAADLLISRVLLYSENAPSTGNMSPSWSGIDALFLHKDFRTQDGEKARAYSASGAILADILAVQQVNDHLVDKIVVVDQAARLALTGLSVGQLVEESSTTNLYTYKGGGESNPASWDPTPLPEFNTLGDYTRTSRIRTLADPVIEKPGQSTRVGQVDVRWLDLIAQPPTVQVWWRVAKIAGAGGRGGGRLRIVTPGGTSTPGEAVYEISTSWTDAIAVTLLSNAGASLGTGAYAQPIVAIRATKANGDGSDTETWIDILVSHGTGGLSDRPVVISAPRDFASNDIQVLDTPIPNATPGLVTAALYDVNKLVAGTATASNSDAGFNSNAAAFKVFRNGMLAGGEQQMQWLAGGAFYGTNPISDRGPQMFGRRGNYVLLNAPPTAQNNTFQIHRTANGVYTVTLPIDVISSDISVVTGIIYSNTAQNRIFTIKKRKLDDTRMEIRTYNVNGSLDGRGVIYFVIFENRIGSSFVPS